MGTHAPGLSARILTADCVVLEALTEGECEVVVDLNMCLIDKRKRMMELRDYYSRSELLSLLIDRTPHARVHEYGKRVEIQVQEEAL